MKNAITTHMKDIPGFDPVELDRKIDKNTWKFWEPNDFGTDEFVRFCRQVGAEPFITANFGSGTPEEAANWVAYCNAPSSTKFGARRAANGHPKPYGIKYWHRIYTPAGNKGIYRRWI